MPISTQLQAQIDAIQTRIDTLAPSATPEDIVAHCKKHLAGFKVPRAVVFGELPKTSTGKIQKFELRKQAGSAAAIEDEYKVISFGPSYGNASYRSNRAQKA